MTQSFRQLTFIRLLLQNADSRSFIGPFLDSWSLWVELEIQYFVKSAQTATFI